MNRVKIEIELQYEHDGSINSILLNNYLFFPGGKYVNINHNCSDWSIKARDN